jgi:hypothetical protein
VSEPVIQNAEAEVPAPVVNEEVVAEAVAEAIAEVTEEAPVAEEKAAE